MTLPQTFARGPSSGEGKDLIKLETLLLGNEIKGK